MKNILFILWVFLSVSCNIAAMDNESSHRNWMFSINLYHDVDKLYIDLEPWFLETKVNISIENSNNIVKLHGKEPSFTNNIAEGRIFIFYINHLKEQKYVIWDLKKIFFSGMTAITHLDLKDSVISAKSSFNKDTPLSEVTKAQKNKINFILGKENFLPTGTCAEASMLIYIDENLPGIIANIKENENNTNFEIVGTLLQISSLKDPCSEKCMPMLLEWMQNMHNILHRSISGIHGVNIAGNLENIVILAGRESHKHSRDEMVEHEGIIKFDLNNPTSRIYSKKND